MSDEVSDASEAEAEAELEVEVEGDAPDPDAPLVLPLHHHDYAREAEEEIRQADADAAADVDADADADADVDKGLDEALQQEAVQQEAAAASLLEDAYVSDGSQDSLASDIVVQLGEVQCLGNVRQLGRPMSSRVEQDRKGLAPPVQPAPVDVDMDRILTGANKAARPAQPSSEMFPGVGVEASVVAPRKASGLGFGRGRVREKLRKRFEKAKEPESHAERVEFNNKVRTEFKGIASGVIFPDNRYVVYWDLLMLSLIGWIVVSVPFQLGISDSQIIFEDGYAFLILTTVNLFFVADTTLNFFRAYFEKGRIVVHKRRIAMHYLRGWFAVDAIACLPVDEVVRFVPSTVNIQALAIVNLLRIFRVGRATRIVNTNAAILQRRLATYNPASDLIFVVFVLMAFAHWAGCLFSMVALFEAGGFEEARLLDTDKPNWLQTYVDQGGVIDVVGNSFHAIWGRYTVALYWAVTTTTSIGYGDITPITLAEHWFTILVELVAGMLWAWTIGSVISIIDELGRAKHVFDHRILEINNLVQRFQPPVDRSGAGAGADRSESTGVGVGATGDSSMDMDTYAPAPSSDADVARDARTFLHKQFTMSMGTRDGTQLSKVADVLSQLPPRLRNRVCYNLVQQDLYQMLYFRHADIDTNTLGGVAAMCEVHQFNTGEIMYLERNTLSAKRGVFVLRTGVLATAESNHIKIKKMRIMCSSGALMHDYVMLPQGSLAQPAIVTVAFWTFTEMVFVPRKAIKALFRLHPAAWRSSGRWAALRATMRRWARQHRREASRMHASPSSTAGRTSHRLVNRYSSDEFHFGGRDSEDVM